MKMVHVFLKELDTLTENCCCEASIGKAVLTQMWIPCFLNPHPVLGSKLFVIGPRGPVSISSDPAAMRLISLGVGP